jgi:hypothetical protein
MENDTGSMRLLWPDVMSVYVFKRDCLTIDQIRMSIQTNHNTSVELTEHMSGWDELLKKLPEYLPGAETEASWWAAVAFPPFEPNLKLIYQRANEGAV